MGKDKKRSSSSKSSSSRDKKKSHKKHKKHHTIQKNKEEERWQKNPDVAQEIKEPKEQKVELVQKPKEELTADEKIEQILDKIKQSNPVEPENPFKNKPTFDLKKKKEPPVFEAMNSAAPKMIEVVVNDRLGKKVRVKCCPDDTILDLKKLIAVQTGTKYDKIRLQKWYNIFKDHITLQDYEIHDGMGLEMYYN